MPRRQRRGVVGDVVGYASERVVRLVLSAVVGIFVARYLGPQALGLLSFAGSVFALLMPLALLGMPTILVRELSTLEDPRPTFASAMALQALAAAVLAAIGFLIVVVARGFERQAVLLGLVLLPLPLLGLEQSVRSSFESMGRMRQIVVAGIVAGVAAASFRLGGLLVEAPVWVFGVAAPIEVGVILGVLVLALPEGLRLAELRHHVRPDLARRLLAESWPLLLAALAVTIYMKADILMLGIISGDRETGIYTAAARLSEVWYFIPTAAAAAVRPRLARMFAAGDTSRYEAATQRFMTALNAIALVTIAGVLLLSDQIIGLLYGSDFLPASPVLRIHILAAPFVFLGVAGSQWFVDRGMTRAVMVRSVVGAVLNVVLNIALIPTYGATGAAIATLAAYALASVALNGFHPSTRPLFLLQAQAFLLRWPRLE